MRQLFEPRARRFESLATASSLGVLLMSIHGAAFAAQADPTLATVVVTGAEATEAQKAEAQLAKVPGKTAVIDNRKIEQGGVRIDSAVVGDKGLKLNAGTYVLQVGKRSFARVTLTA